MTGPIRIALDVMGGDRGPEVTLPGTEVALSRHPLAEALLFGDERKIRPLLERHPRVKARGRIHHTEIAVRMDDKPSQALRAGRWRSSMWLALDAVRTGAADVAVSAGNTGALMAMARFSLKMIAGIERPAIAAIWPTLRGESIVLDVGASIGDEAQQLVDNAVMGGAMARALFGLERPSIGLLNIGVEEVKGVEEVRKAGVILKDLALPGIEYYGFVEGDDIGSGTVDVVVTEGFSGNIALKTAEGTARQISTYLRSALTRTWPARVGALLAKGAFDTLREKMDPRRMNGGVFLGLNGVVIKSHGGTDAEGFASAIDLGHDMAQNGLVAKIRQDLVHYRGGRSAEPAALSRAEAS